MKKIIVWVVILAVIGFGLAYLLNRGGEPTTGGALYETRLPTFTKGIKIGSPATQVIDSSGNWDGAITGTTGTFTSTLTPSGKFNPAGGTIVDITAITTSTSLTAAMCGDIVTVSAGIDTGTITLPEASTVLGCSYHISYIGADGGALLDISPLDSDADGIEGTCTLAASVVTLSGTADADMGFTKASIQTGDSMTLRAASASQWVMTGATGICANN